MQTLLSTKLNVPPSRQTLVLRPGLVTLLTKARIHALTLVSAPPGYGKTTLVSSWLRDTDLPFTWLSLDESDNDPIRFLEYFLTALHAVVPAIRPDLLELLQGSQAASFETLMALLINEAAGNADFFIVLDDFHVLHAPPIIDMLGYLLEHLPPEIHMLLLSRTDPALPLSRLRARGQLLEIRAEQLRFSAAEIFQFFDEVMGLELSASDICAIEIRTEGWIAGLQLAGLAMQAALVSHDGFTQVERDPHSFIAAFSGSQAYIMDYLTDEVLSGQPEPVRSFLLQTAVLERMCGPLCEAVTGTGAAESVDSQAMLEAVERNHLFVTPLDGERRWFRYHHLFKEVLLRRLEVQYPGQIPGLLCRASDWFERQGLIHEAIQYATNAGDTDRIARLVEQHGCTLLMSGELVTLGGWLAAIEPYTHTRPWLAMQKAWVLALSGQAERAERAIAACKQLLSPLELTDEVRTLRGSLAAAQALWANTQGKSDLAAQHAREAIDILCDNTDFSCSLRIVATSLLGDASLDQGKLEEARRAYADAVQIGAIAGNPHMVIMPSTGLADIYFEQGQLHQAARLYGETLQMAGRVDGPNSSYAQGVHFGLSRVFYAWNRLDEAAASSEKCFQLCEQWGNVNLRAACLALTARLERASGRVEKAQQAAAEALAREQDLSPYWSMWVKTTLARSWLEQGQIEKAFFLIRDLGVFPDTFTPETLSLAGIPLDVPVPYRLEQVYLLLAQLLLKLGRPADALTLSACLMEEAKTWGWGKTVLELFILQALAHQVRKDIPSALATLESAISLAWPEQSARAFLDEGEAMGKLLYQAKARGTGGEFVTGLLVAMEKPAPSEPPVTRVSQKIPVETKARQGQRLLVEPLSARELEILGCIAEGYSNQEIAGRFVLSPLTVKRHISNIYAKLEAKNRTQAVSLARALKLID